MSWGFGSDEEQTDSKPLMSYHEEEENYGVVEDLIDDVWPHPEYRDGQKEIILDALKSTIDEGNRFYVICAPVGSGKSPVNYTIAKLVGELEEYEGTLPERATSLLSDGLSGVEGGYYITPQNVLLEQLWDDYAEEGDLGMIQGKSNYQCKRDGQHTCTDGPCQFGSQDCINYKTEYDSALGSPITSTNFAKLAVDENMERRPAVIIDEAHMMGQSILSTSGLSIRDEDLEFTGDYDKAVYDQIADKKRNGLTFNWDLKTTGDFDTHIRWMKMMKRRLDALLSDMGKYIHILLEERDVYDRKIGNVYQQLNRLKDDIQFVISDYEETGEEWIIGVDEEWDTTTVSYQPITPQRLLHRDIFSKGDHVIISSATPPANRVINIPNNDTERIEIESPFPVRNRPIEYRPVGKLSAKHREDNLFDLTNEITEVAEGKTLIHSKSYDFADSIATDLQKAVGTYDVIKQDQYDRGGSLQEWIDGDAQYFVSVGMYDGIDLDGDKCRTNIVTSLPFPRLSEQVKRRKQKEGEGFYRWQTAMKVEQGVGRATRSEDDWSHSYIMDENFGWFYQRNKHYFHGWFEDALQWNN